MELCTTLHMGAGSSRRSHESMQGTLFCAVGPKPPLVCSPRRVGPLRFSAWYGGWAPAQDSFTAPGVALLTRVDLKDDLPPEGFSNRRLPRVAGTIIRNVVELRGLLQGLHEVPGRRLDIARGHDSTPAGHLQGARKESWGQTMDAVPRKRSTRVLTPTGVDFLRSHNDRSCNQ